MSRSSSTV